MTGEGVSLPDVIRIRRQELGLTIEDLAKILVMPPAYVGMVEQGHRSLELTKVPMWAAALEFDVVDFCRLALFEKSPVFYFALIGPEYPVWPRRQSY